ncbi:MAG: GNAT family N-acetyltransferase [Tannerella sp.]|jgi:ribosomal protein S18 acetylase RimI-like enzyme|nr:GNAT family N-acetyltransferase [Tannerella sp.]
MISVNITSCNYSDPAHLDALVSLINAYIDDEMGGGKSLSQPEQRRLIEGLSNHPKSIVLLAETGGVFIGLLTAFENFSTFTTQPMVNIHDVFVSKEYRRKGVGRQLMNAVISEAENRGSSRITLEVRNDNVSAQNLYRSLGFEDTDPSMFYWRKYL